MLASLLAAVAAFAFGYLWFWIAPLSLKSKTMLGPAFIGHKYLGFRNYRDLRWHVLVANAVWAPITGALCVLLLVDFGWRDALWVLGFPCGYALSFRRFLKKPRKSWDDEKLPLWPFF